MVLPETFLLCLTNLAYNFKVFIMFNSLPSSLLHHRYKNASVNVTVNDFHERNESFLLNVVFPLKFVLRLFFFLIIGSINIYKEMERDESYWTTLKEETFETFSSISVAMIVEQSLGLNKGKVIDTHWICCCFCYLYISSSISLSHIQWFLSVDVWKLSLVDIFVSTF